jgi:hypothetical protein
MVLRTEKSRERKNRSSGRKKPEDAFVSALRLMPSVHFYLAYPAYPEALQLISRNFAACRQKL